MERQYVTSSNFRSVGYDLNSKTLEIEFNDGAIYQYYNVPQYEYDGLMSAASKGKYASQNIYKKYSQQKIV